MSHLQHRGWAMPSWCARPVGSRGRSVPPPSVVHTCSPDWPNDRLGPKRRAGTYNAAWQHRRDAWARARVSVSRFDQSDEIPEIRAVRPDVVRFGNQVGGVDRGITVTAALSDGTTISLPGFLKEARGVIAERQRAREQTERFSPAGRKHSRAIAQVSAKAHRQSENWARHTAKDIVAA